MNLPIAGCMIADQIYTNQDFIKRIVWVKIQDMLPTLLHRPRWRRSRLAYENRITSQGRGRELEMELGGPLNPEWADWFMGFEKGWTE